MENHMENNFREIQKILDSCIAHDYKTKVSKRDIRLEAEDSALEVMADQGYDPQFGARPIKRVIQRDLMNELSRQILEGKVEPKDVIVIKGQNNALVFENKRA